MTHYRYSAFLAAAALLTLALPLSAEPVGKPDSVRQGAAAPVDPAFDEPYVDLTECRDHPVRHRYVHGGFRNTDTRFSFYLPPTEQYEGRFFQHITHMPLSEKEAQKQPIGSGNKIGFAVDSGAYFVESNGGGDGSVDGQTGDPTISAYRANAAVAQYSRRIASDFYGPHRPFGYAYGGSGGGYRTIGGMENTEGVWDGAVPYVIGSSVAIPNVFTVRMQALRILADRFPQIVDATEPGGSGDIYAGLNSDERAALEEVTRMGFPPKAWFGYKSMDLHGFAVLFESLVAIDPSYFQDFWTKPGYAGYEPSPSLIASRVQLETTIASLLTSEQARERKLLDSPSQAGGVDGGFHKAETAEQAIGLVLADLPQADLLAADLTVLSGEAAGLKLILGKNRAGAALFGPGAEQHQKMLGKLKIGDKIRVDNSNFLASQTYHRHQDPGEGFPVWDQFRDSDGRPIYPQRPILVGPLMSRGASGTVQSGKFSGKMIVVESLWDREAYPWQADWYQSKVKAHVGDRLDDVFRVYYTDHALHGDDGIPEDANRVVVYTGMLEQSLRDLSAWVEDGLEPPSSTRTTVRDGQVLVPEKASDRRGLQPVVTLSVDGQESVVVERDTTVRFEGEIEAPPGVGKVVSAEWDLDGDGVYTQSSRLPRENRSKVRVRLQSKFSQPGTYFVALRGATHRQGDRHTPYARIENLGRVRVVVR